MVTEHYETRELLKEKERRNLKKAVTSIQRLAPLSPEANGGAVGRDESVYEIN